MRAWIQVAMTGAGTDGDEKRPDLAGAALDGYAVAASDGETALVVVSGTASELRKLADSVVKESTLEGRAAALGAGPGWSCEGYGV